jgi:hypothetical protein
MRLNIRLCGSLFTPSINLVDSKWSVTPMSQYEVPLHSELFRVGISCVCGGAGCVLTDIPCAACLQMFRRGICNRDVTHTLRARLASDCAHNDVVKNGGVRLLSRKLCAAGPWRSARQVRRFFVSINLCRGADSLKS